MRKQDEYIPMAYEEHIRRREARRWGNSIFISYPTRSEILMNILEEFNREEWRKIKGKSYAYSATITPTVKNARSLCRAIKIGADKGCSQCKGIFRNMKSGSKEYIFEIQYKERKVEFDAMVSKIS